MRGSVDPGHCVTMLTNGSSAVGVCNAPCLWSIPMVNICASWWSSVAHTRSVLSGCCFHCFEYWGALYYSFSFPQPFSVYGRITAQGTWQRVTQSVCLPPWWGWVFSRFVPPTDTVKFKSVLGVKPGVSGMVIGVRLMNLLALGQWSTSLLDYTFTLVSWQCINSNPCHFNQAVIMTPFWTMQAKTFRVVFILSLLTLLTSQNWRYPLMRLMPCLLQCLQGFYAWWVSILIILDWRLLLASNVIDYGARLGHYFYWTTGG